MKDGLPDAVADAADASDVALDAAVAEQQKRHAEGIAASSDTDALPPAPAPAAPAPENEGRISELEARLAAEQQRVRSLQGRIDSQGPTMAAQISELKDTVKALQADLTQAKKVPAHLRNLSAEERKMLSDDGDLSIEVRQAKGYTDEAKEHFDAKIAAMEQRQTESDRAREAEAIKSEANAYKDRFFAKLEVIAPGATALDANPVFRAWLPTPDPDSLTGATFEAKAQDAYARGDIKAVKAVTDVFYATDPGRRIQSDLAAQVKPSNAPGNEPPVEQKGNWFTEDAIAEFYHYQNLRRPVQGRDGKDLTPEEMKKLENDIEDAVANDRVRVGR